MKLVVAFQALIISLLIQSSPAASPLDQEAFVPVFVGGEDGYACYRIPALLKTAKGNLIAVADGRISGCGDIPNPLDLVLKRSLDNGKTWGPLQVIADYGKNPADTDIYPTSGVTNPLPRVAAGDAALLLDRTNGRVWVFYDNGAALRGKFRNRAMKLEMRYSDDEGLTWSPAIDLESRNPGLRPPGLNFMASPGNGIQLTSGSRAGRLIFAAYIHGGPDYSAVIYSDDHGESWHLGGKSAQGGGESQIAETRNGGLFASIRNNAFPEAGVRYFNVSPDGGSSWGTPYCQTTNQPPLPDPKCQGSVIGVRGLGTEATALVMLNAAHPSARSNATLRVSYDEGRTWAVSNQVYAGGSAYSALTQLSTGEVGMLLEIDKYKRIVFVRSKVP
jgi:sialidase-1